MMNAYIKPEDKKTTIAMNTALTEAAKNMKISISRGWFFCCRIFLLLDKILSTGFPPKDLGEGAGQSIINGNKKQDQRRETFSIRWWI